MSQDRLSALSVLAIETELVQQPDFNDIIETFAQKNLKKARRVVI